MHFCGVAGDGCSGIGIWVFNTLLNTMLLVSFSLLRQAQRLYDDGGATTAHIHATMATRTTVSARVEVGFEADGRRRRS
ncbi:hypothetical protein E2562_016242 [Oryza meyeriana var. granulata]|uniref:Uncharacterized protein n=1 Tax=Oryza meyeriana var. granulata TaxID=110450 RepID=A0A6G1CQK2_9ORYZ|nr:hypothetical protein E2562_016242 [Oryza meyeriana var. granulata]